MVISLLVANDLASNLLSIEAILGDFFKMVNIYSKKSKMNGMGRILPIKHIINEEVKGRFRSEAAINPPRSSNIGNSEIKKIIILPFKLPNKFTKKFANDSVI